MEFREGELIDYQYTVQEKRKGGMGVVYFVFDKFSGKRFAVKSIREEYLEEPNAIGRFKREAKVWLNLGHHDNMVQALFFREVGQTPLLFMEFVDGTDLGRLIAATSSLPLPQVLDFGVQMCHGMVYACSRARKLYEEGLVHRDLKPGNVLVSRDRRAKITDFGLVKVRGEFPRFTRPGVGLGTPAYMPPEQLKESAEVDQRSDIYSLGVMLYEMAVGRRPFVGHTDTELYDKIMKASPRAPSEFGEHLPREFDALVLECLEKSPAHRPQSFEQLEGRLAALRVTSAALKGTETVCTKCGLTLFSCQGECPLCEGGRHKPYALASEPPPPPPGKSEVQRAERPTVVDRPRQCGCGASLKEGQRFCTACGQRVDGTTTGATAGKCQCGAALKPDQKHCHSCGAASSHALRSCGCGQLNPLSRRFCSQCGKRLTS